MPTMRAGALDLSALAQGSFRNTGPGSHGPCEVEAVDGLSS